MKKLLENIKEFGSIFYEQVESTEKNIAELESMKQHIEELASKAKKEKDNIEVLTQMISQMEQSKSDTNSKVLGVNEIVISSLLELNKAQSNQTTTEHHIENIAEEERDPPVKSIQSETSSSDKIKLE